MTEPLPDCLAASPLLGQVAKLSRAELEALQLRKLREQLERLSAGSAYYRARLQAAKFVDGLPRSLAEYADRFPTSNKTDFLADQEAHPAFGERLGIAREQVALVNLTGGTSGQGQEIYGRSQRDVHLQGYLHALPWFMAGLRPGDVAMNCVPAGGMTTGGWGPGEGLRIVGATAFHVGGNLSTDAALDLMKRIGGAHFIYASTNYLHTLTQAMAKRALEPRDVFPDIRTLFIAAEGYPVEWAQAIRERWGAALHEGYGSTQLAGFGGATLGDGVVTRAGGRGPIRLFEWEHVVEILDPATMQPVAPGEVGEMVVTNLSVEGSPVIRFRTGDAARFVPWQEAGGPAWNGIESGTIGRFDDMMKIRGNNVWPSAIDAAVFACPEVEEYAGRVYTSADGKTEIEVRVALTSACSDFTGEAREAVLQRVRSAIKARTNVYMDIVETVRSELPQFAYKARRWKDERQQGYRL